MSHESCIINPRPYESSWSYLSRCLAGYMCKPSAIYAALVRERSVCFNGLNYRSKIWIDDEKLKNGSFSGLGSINFFYRFQSDYDLNRKKDGLRHCPECLKSRYHSFVFELPFVTECPIHGIKLLPPCKECHYLVERIGFQLYVDDEHLKSPNSKEVYIGPDVFIRSKCGHISYNIGRDININQSICIDFFKMGLIADGIISLENKIPGVISQLCDLYKQNDARFDSLLRLESTKYFQEKFNPEHIDSYFFEFSLDDQVDDGGIIDVFRNFKSISHNIKKRFIEGKHASCLKYLMNLEESERHSLNLHHVCAISLAYESWRMSLINMFENQKENCLRIINKFGVRLTTFMIYCHFFGILNILNKFIRKREIFEVYVSGSRYGFNFKAPFWKANGKYYIIRCHSEDIDQCSKRCDILDMIDWDYEYNYQVWQWSRFDNSIDRRLFVVSNKTKRGSRRVLNL